MKYINTFNVAKEIEIELSPNFFTFFSVVHVGAQIAYPQQTDEKQQHLRYGINMVVGDLEGIHHKFGELNVVQMLFTAFL